METLTKEPEVMDEKNSVINVKIEGRYARALKAFEKNSGESSHRAAVHGLIRKTSEFQDLERTEQPDLAGG